MEHRNNMLGYLIRYSNWFANLIEGRTPRSGRGLPRQENVDVVKERRTYVVINRLSTERKKLQTDQPLG